MGRQNGKTSLGYSLALSYEDTHILYGAAIPFLVFYPRKMKTHSQTNTYTLIIIAALFTTSPKT